MSRSLDKDHCSFLFFKKKKVFYEDCRVGKSVDGCMKYYWNNCAKVAVLTGFFSSRVMNTLPPEVLLHITNKLEWHEVAQLRGIGNRQLLLMLVNGGIEMIQLCARPSDLELTYSSTQLWATNHLHHLEVNASTLPTKLRPIQPEMLPSSLLTLVLSSPILFSSLDAFISPIPNSTAHMLRFPCPNLKTLSLNGSGPGKQLLIDHPPHLTSLTFHFPKARYETPLFLKDLPPLLTICHISVFHINDDGFIAFTFPPLLTDLRLGFLMSSIDYVAKLPPDLRKLHLNVSRSAVLPWKWEALPRKLEFLSIPVRVTGRHGRCTIFRTLPAHLPPTLKVLELDRKLRLEHVQTVEEMVALIPPKLESLEGILPNRFVSYLPQSITSLTGSLINGPEFDPMTLPVNLTELWIAQSLCQALPANFTFPSRLTSLKFDAVLRSDLFELLPLTLKTLKLKEGIYQHAQLALLPESLTSLELPFQTDDAHAKLPNRLTDLKMLNTEHDSHTPAWSSHILHLTQTLTSLTVGSTVSTALASRLSKSWIPISHFSKLVTLRVSNRGLETNWLHLIPRTVSTLNLNQFSRPPPMAMLKSLPPNLTNFFLNIDSTAPLLWTGPELTCMPKTLRALSIIAHEGWWNGQVMKAYLPPALTTLTINYASIIPYDGME
jgi:hypothetical protein